MQRILVIDDDDEIRDDIIDILKLKGFMAEGASNGRIGLEAAKKNHPDLILCDIDMPELDGYGVLQELQRDPALNNIPFIFLTALFSMDKLRKGMNLGADDYLTKPLQIEYLLAAIAARFRRQAQRKVNVDISICEELLTNRQREILRLVANGMTTKEIAESLFISVKTVEAHRGNLMERLNIHDLSGLIRYALRVGLINLDE